jgi:hypothetical protein
MLVSVLSGLKYTRDKNKRESLGFYLLRQSRTDFPCWAKRLVEHLNKESVEDLAIRCLSIKLKFVGEDPAYGETMCPDPL